MNLPLKQLNLAGGDGYIGPSFPLPPQSPSPRKLPSLKFPTKSGTGTWDWDVSLGDVGLGDVGLGDVGLGDVGLGDVGLGDTRGLGDVINKQHLTFALNL